MHRRFSFMDGRREVFPQANSVALILKTLALIGENKKITKQEIADQLSIVSRQVDYYLNVLYYFELISRNNELTLKGKFINDPVIDKHDQLVILKNIMIEKPVFKLIDDYINKNGKVPSSQVIAEYIQEWYSLSNSTLMRRASTVKSWFDYYIYHHIYGEL